MVSTRVCHTRNEGSIPFTCSIPLIGKLKTSSRFLSSIIVVILGGCKPIRQERKPTGEKPKPDQFCGVAGHFSPIDTKVSCSKTFVSIGH